MTTGLENVSFHSNPNESEVAQSCLTLCDPMDSSLHHAALSMGFSRQEYWSGLPFPSPIPKKGNAKECSNYRTIALISHSSKVMLKILQARLQQYVNLEKAGELEIKLPTSAGSSKKQESSRKTSISALLTMPKSLTVWITINCGKF